MNRLIDMFIILPMVKSVVFECESRLLIDRLLIVQLSIDKWLTMVDHGWPLLIDRLLTM